MFLDDPFPPRGVVVVETSVPPLTGKDPPSNFPGV